MFNGKVKKGQDFPRPGLRAGRTDGIDSMGKNLIVSRIAPSLTQPGLA
jgi:hypothetical protein